VKDFIGKKFTLAVIALVLAALACNLPSQKPNTDAVLTAIAGTEQATAATSTPTTSSTVFVTVSTATNCRTGPGTNYDLVLVFQPGQTAEVVGKYTPSNYWIIKTPTGGTCWLWGAYAAVQGDTSTLAEMVPPAPPPTTVAQNPTKVPKNKSSPTATSAAVVNPNPILVNPGLYSVLAPSQPSNLTIQTDCTPPGRDVELTWSNVSGADGYYVYENGNQISQQQNTRLNHLNPSLPSGNITYGVAAYNSYGTSAQTKVTSYCP